MLMTSGAASGLRHQFTPSVWYAVTVRVAWTLMMEGIRVRPQTLADARDHVLLSTPSGTDTETAERRAGPLTKEFLSRVRGESIRRIALKDASGVDVQPAWRRRLTERLDPIEDAVLRLHYGDGMPLDQVERSAAIEASSLAHGREGLRDRVRSIASSDGFEAHLWNDSRVDHLVGRIANLAEPGCPSPLDILSDHNRAHADGCPRCSRAVRLIRGGVISPSDLEPQEGGTIDAEVAVGSIILHPDARRSRRKLERALGAGAIRVAPDVWLMSKQELTQAGPALRALVDNGVLPRHHLRGAIVRGPGRWSGQVLLGPTPIEAIESARSRPWSEVDSLGELPPPRPAPPRATRLWIMASILCLMAGVVGYQTIGPQNLLPAAPIEADFLLAEDGWEVTFDLEDLAVLDIVALGDEGLTIVHRGVREARGQWSTGGGNYRVYVPEKTVVLIASEAGVPDLFDLVKSARSQPTPMEFLEVQVQTAHPTVAWVASPAITTDETAAVIVGPQ